MASTYLTPTAVTRAIASVLHQRGKFLNRINKQYDAQYADNGQRKGGGSIKIRMPNEYTVRSGTIMNVQDVTEGSETLTIGTMKGVDLNFSDTDLALSIEDFTERFIDPAVAALVSAIEADVIIGCSNSVANMIDGDGAAPSFLHLMQAKQRLAENLCDVDNEDALSLFLTPTHNTKLVDAFKGLFAPAGQVGGQFKSGMLQPVAGVGWVGTSTHLTDLTTGTAVKGDTVYDTDIAGGEATGSVAASGIHIDTGSTTFKTGEVFEIESVNAVHPETKTSLGYRKQFVVASDFAGSEGDLIFSVGIGGHTGIDATTAKQNVNAAAADGKIIYKVGAGNGELLNRSLYFHRNAFAVAFADLENPKRYGAWGDTVALDNVSVRLWRQGNIVNGTFPCRLDVLYGYKAIRPQLACRIHADG